MLNDTETITEIDLSDANIKDTDFDTEPHKVSILAPYTKVNLLGDEPDIEFIDEEIDDTSGKE